MHGTHHGSVADASQASDNNAIENRCNDLNEEAHLLASYSEHTTVEEGGQHVDEESRKANKERNENFVQVDTAFRRSEIPVKKDNGFTDDSTTQEESSSLEPNDVRQNSENHSCCSEACQICRKICQKKYLCSKFSIVSLGCTLFSIGTYLFDVITDVKLIFWYHDSKENDPEYTLFFRLTLGFVLVPSIVVQLFSKYFFYDDFRKEKKRLKSKCDANQNVATVSLWQKVSYVGIAVLHIFQLSVLFRYAKVLVLGFRSRYYDGKNERDRDHFDKLWKREVNDVSFLRLLESFLESAPQLVLQIYVMLTKGRTTLKIVSCLASLGGLSTSMMSVQRAIRNATAGKDQLSIPATVTMLMWRVFEICSRVLAFSLFLTVQPMGCLILFIAHWAIASILIAVEGTTFCVTKATEIFFDAIAGLVHLFCYLNVHEGRRSEMLGPRVRMWIFYIIIFIENMTISIYWFCTREESSAEIILLESNTTTAAPLGYDGVITTYWASVLLSLVVVFYALGIIFMIVYYTIFHPQKYQGGICACSGGNVTNMSTFEVSEPGNPQILDPQRLGIQYQPVFSVKELGDLGKLGVIESRRNWFHDILERID